MTSLPTFDVTEVVPASEVDRYVGIVWVELAALNDEVAAAEAVVREAEQRLVDNDYSYDLTVGATQQLETYLGELTSISRREFREALDQAVADATERRARAHSEVEAMLANARAAMGSQTIEVAPAVIELDDEPTV